MDTIYQRDVLPFLVQLGLWCCVRATGHGILSCPGSSASAKEKPGGGKVLAQVPNLAPTQIQSDF